MSMNLFGPPNAYGYVEPTHARNTDPETSHEAADAMVSSGKLNRHCEAVLGIIKRCPRSTYHELWAAATEDERAELGDAQALQRRLSDLERRGQIRRLPKRKCTIHTSSTMQPVEAV